MEAGADSRPFAEASPLSMCLRAPKVIKVVIVSLVMLARWTTNSKVAWVT